MILVNSASYFNAANAEWTDLLEFSLTINAISSSHLSLYLNFTHKSMESKYINKTEI